MAQPPKSFQQVLRELWELLKAYAQQETIGPLRNLGRRIGLGIAGSFLFAFGWLLITLGVMRVLQTHTTFFREHDWVTYFVAVGLLAVAIGGVVNKIARPPADLTTDRRRARQRGADRRAGAAGTSPERNAR